MKYGQKEHNVKNCCAIMPQPVDFFGQTHGTILQKEKCESFHKFSKTVVWDFFIDMITEDIDDK